MAGMNIQTFKHTHIFTKHFLHIHILRFSHTDTHTQREDLENCLERRIKTHVSFKNMFLSCKSLRTIATRHESSCLHPMRNIFVVCPNQIRMFGVLKHFSIVIWMLISSISHIFKFRNAGMRRVRTYEISFLTRGRNSLVGATHYGTLSLPR